MLQKTKAYADHLLNAFLIGVFAGGILFKGGGKGILFGFLLGAVLFLMLFEWLTRLQKEVIISRLRTALGGILPGAILGAHFLPQKAVMGAFISAIAWACILYSGVAAFIHRRKEKGHYQPYAWEMTGTTLLGLTGLLLGTGIAALILGKISFLQSIPSVRWILDLLLSVLISLFFSFLPGFVLASNRKRPALGSVISFVGGCFILWFGISIAPLLFLPGSGLLWSGLIMGSFLILFSLLSLIYLQMRVILGSLIIVVSILSFVGAAGGLILGGIFGMLGGVLIVSWHPPDMQPSHRNFPLNNSGELSL
jgi:hypothetical protein